MHVRTDDRAAVIATVRASGFLPAYVGAAAGGWIGVYPRATETQDPEVLATITGALSRDFGDAIAILVHDSDVFAYWIFRGGELADSYDSAPDYFEGGESPPRGGDAAVLDALAPGQGAAVAELLHDPDDAIVFAEELAGRFGAMIGIGATRACCGFGAAAHGDTRDAGLELLE